MSADRATIEGLLRALAPQALGALVRRYGQFELSEDAVQEALLAAATRWPTEGVPDNPRGWLTTVAGRRLVDQIRSEQARRRREDEVAAREPDPTSPGPGEDTPANRDDTLTLLFLCCHPALSPASQIALTLRAVGGLTTAEIARAYFVPEPTMAARISRAKQRIRAVGSEFTLPVGQDRVERLRVVLHVLYVISNEGYTASSGDRLRRDDLAAEAIRLTRLLHRLLPDDGAVAGLLALMLLTDARRAARTGPHGELIRGCVVARLGRVQGAHASAVRGESHGDFLAGHGDGVVADDHRALERRGQEDVEDTVQGARHLRQLTSGWHTRQRRLGARPGEPCRSTDGTSAP
ncbi:RNA polymerase sigma factor [Streptomyces sp. NPDC059153]|uniref:RNA polymerase sigma factor n=1 Tax=Streptomyces sp. NPDC059153 TaxID=3346743 RepID=UPI0036BBD495